MLTVVEGQRAKTLKSFVEYNILELEARVEGFVTGRLNVFTEGYLFNLGQALEQAVAQTGDAVADYDFLNVGAKVDEGVNVANVEVIVGRAGTGKGKNAGGEVKSPSDVFTNAVIADYVVSAAGGALTA